MLTLLTKVKKFAGIDPILLAKDCQQNCLLSVTLYVWAENRTGRKS